MKKNITQPNLFSGPTFFVLLGIICSILLQSCGGGGSTSTPETSVPQSSITPPSTTSPSSPVTSTGVIARFGSVFVNGTEFETNSAEIKSDGSNADETSLRVGQVVTLKGSINDDGTTGTAVSINYNDLLEGPISNINGNILIVLGQTIITDEGTVFDESLNSQSLAGLSVGDVIEVSGLLNSNGEIVATYVEKRAPGGEYELVGVVSNLDITESRFDLGRQVIEFSGAELKDFDSTLANGDQVEVKGDSFNIDGDLIAVIVELQKTNLDINDNVELEGLVTRFESVSDFDVFDTVVSTTTGTDFVRGAADDLAIDVKLEVEGSINTDGVLIATKIEFKRKETTRIEASVDSVDVNTNQLTVLGITVTITLTTQLKDDSDLDVFFFGLNDLSAGDFVEIRGVLETDGTLTATRLERDEASNEGIRIKGLVSSTDGATSLVIAGVTVRTNDETQYRNEADETIVQSEFFAIALIGIEVEAEGEETGVSEISATELSLQDNI